MLTDRGDIVILEEASKSGNMILREQARLSHEGCQAISFGPKEGGLQLVSACSKGHVRWLSPTTGSITLLYMACPAGLSTILAVGPLWGY